MDKGTMEIRDTKWLEIVKACNESGMRKVDWCREHGITSKTFYYHQTRIRRAMLAAMDSTDGNSQIEVSKKSLCYAGDSRAVTELQLRKDNSGVVFVPDAVIKTGGTSIEISNTISNDLLSLLLKSVCHAE